LPIATAWRKPTIAVANVYVALPEERKGTHMSRLVMLLEGVPPWRAAADRGEVCVTCSTISWCAWMPRWPGRVCISVLRAQDGAGVGRGEPSTTRSRWPANWPRKVREYRDGRGTVTSLCPCSKEIADYGAHNQRSLITITVRPHAPVFVQELLRIAEERRRASCTLLKRADEKYVTERAYDNPRFVEDLVRGVAGRLAADPRFDGFSVEAENFESIHSHSACIAPGLWYDRTIRLARRRRRRFFAPATRGSRAVDPSPFVA
jgi:hypothetical protein